MSLDLDWPNFLVLFTCFPSFLPAPALSIMSHCRDKLPAERCSALCPGTVVGQHLCIFPVLLLCIHSLLLSQPLGLLLPSSLPVSVSNKYPSYGRSFQTTGVYSVSPNQPLPAQSETLCQPHLCHEHPAIFGAHDWEGDVWSPPK